MESVNSQTVVALVAEVTGKVLAKSLDGQVRTLKVGDSIFKDDVIITEPGANAQLISVDGAQLHVDEQQSVKIDNDVFGAIKPNAIDSAIAPIASTDAERIIQALNSNQDLSVVLDETAAGMTGSGVEQGHFFVQLLRINEGLTQSSFDFGTNTGNPVQLNRVQESLDPLGFTIDTGVGNLPNKPDGSGAQSIDAAKKPAIASTGTGSTQEDITTTVGGTLTVTGGVTFVPQTLTGTYGSVTVAADGTWTYVLDNASPAVQGLAAGQTVNEPSFTITLSD
ncbi:MAG: retention module-containing protein, partial [Sideroxydans sp.]|nr:retention module-containing protein [Sideroxydans sp.]